MAAAPAQLEKLVAVATLGTRRAPAPKEFEWPDDSLAAAGAAVASPETRLLRAAAAHALYSMAGGRSAPDASVETTAEFAAAGRVMSDAAAWRLARIIGGEHRYLLDEWFALASSSGRVLPPHYLPLVLEHVPPEQRAGTGAILGPAASWLAARHPDWMVEAPQAGLSDLRWKEGLRPERLADLKLARQTDRVRSRAWLRTTWEQDSPDAREAFLLALLPTVEPADEEFLEMALDDKRKSVRQAAAEALSRLPGSKHARRNLERLGNLLQLVSEKSGLLGLGRKRRLVIELPSAPDKAAIRDGIEVKVPAALKIGERAYWLMQMVARVPPRHWCEKFSCDASTFLAAVLESDYAEDLSQALTEAVTRHPEREWGRLLARHWLDKHKNFVDHLELVAGMIRAAAPDDRVAIVELLAGEARAANVDHVQHLVATLDVDWSAQLTNVAFDMLERIVRTDTAQWSRNRNELDQWAVRCERATGAARGAALLASCGDSNGWRNTLEQFNDIVAFRTAMQEELKP